MRPEPAAPQPVDDELSKPTRVYTDVYGDPHNVAHVPISELMSHAACVDETATARALAHEAHEVIAVVDAHGSPLGLVTRHTLAHADRDATAGALATRNVMTLPEWTPLGRAAALMAYDGIEHILVVSSRRKLVGLLTSRDVLRWLAKKDGYAVPGR